MKPGCPGASSSVTLIRRKRVWEQRLGGAVPQRADPCRLAKVLETPGNGRLRRSNGRARAIAPREDADAVTLVVAGDAPSGQNSLLLETLTGYFYSPSKYCTWGRHRYVSFIDCCRRHYCCFGSRDGRIRHPGKRVQLRQYVHHRRDHGGGRRPHHPRDWCIDRPIAARRRNAGGARAAAGGSSDRTLRAAGRGTCHAAAASAANSVPERPKPPTVDIPPPPAAHAQVDRPVAAAPMLRNPDASVPLVEQFEVPEHHDVSLSPQRMPLPAALTEPEPPPPRAGQDLRAATTTTTVRASLGVAAAFRRRAVEFAATAATAATRGAANAIELFRYDVAGGQEYAETGAGRGTGARSRSRSLRPCRSRRASRSRS